MKRATTQFLTFCLFGLLINQARASGDQFPTGGRAASLADASVTFTDVFATSYNQAGIAFIDRASFGLYTERRFLTTGISFVNAAAVMPTNSGNFGLNMTYYGYDVYNETKVGLAYARKFGDKFSAGLQFDYLRIHQQELGDKNAFTFELGFQYEIQNFIKIGAHIFNPVRIKLEETYGERLPSIMKFGMAYMPSRKLTISAEVEKDIDYKPVFKGGLEYDIIKQLSLRAGVSTNPTIASFGLGINLGSLEIDVGSSFHPTLGYTPHLGLVYALKKKQTTEP